jgi:hypothetical protein
MTFCKAVFEATSKLHHITDSIIAGPASMGRGINWAECKIRRVWWIGKP